MPDIKSVPIMEPVAEPAPRRRGRPPKVDPVTGERVHAPRGTGSTRGRPPRSLEPQIGAMLTTVNVVIMLIPPLSRDALDAAEITALAKSIDAQARQSPRFRKYVERMLAVGSGGQLIGVIGIIAARRAARHGMAPEILDTMLGAMLEGNTDAIGSMAFAPQPDTSPDPVTGETPPNKPFDFDSTLAG